MSAASFKKTVLDAMAGALKGNGFKKRASVLSREVGDVVQLVSLQSSQQSTSDCIRVTVNIAVCIPRLLQDGLPSVWDGHWHKRIGDFAAVPADRWWTIASAENAAQAASEICETLEASVVPTLQSLSSSSALLQLWRSGQSPGITKGQASRLIEALR
jgi:thioesterase domain-containing protein